MTRLRNIAFLLLAVLACGLANAAPQKVQKLDSIVAIVNDSVITHSQLMQQMAGVERQLRQSKTPMPSKANLQKQVLNHMIDQELQLQVAKRAGLKISDQQLDKSIAGIAKRNKITVAQLKQQVQAQGVSYPAYRANIRREMMISEMSQRVVASKIKITPQEVDEYLAKYKKQANTLTEYHLEHILIALPDAPTPTQVMTAKKKADNVVKQATSGTDFKKLAVAESDDDDALKGGDLGWRRLAQLPAIFADQAVKMQPGQIVGPIRAPNGYHIIKLVGKRGGAAQKHIIVLTNVRHILLRPNALQSSAQVKEQLEKIRADIVSGKVSFADMARKYSDDTDSAINGGKLGWVKPGLLVPPFEAAMNKLKVGQISQPVRTQFGWHLIEVLGRKQEDVTKQFQKNQIERLIYARKYDQQVAKWLGQLRSIAYIKIMPGY